METVLRYKREDLMNFVIRYMTKLGVSEDHARIVGKVLLCADLRGVESHGLHRMASYYGNRIRSGFMDPATPWKIESETLSTALIDGGNGLGQVTGYHAMKMTINKAKQCGIGMVTVRNSNHYGIAGYYALMALEDGMIGLSMTNSQPLVAPTYGRTAVLGTNPIAVAAPSGRRFPYLLDMATSAVVEILCSVLSGGSFLTQVGGPSRPGPSGVSHFFMAINIEAFRPVFDFKESMDQMIDLLKASPLAVGCDEILVAGEKEFEYAKFNREHGVPLIKPIVDDLVREGEKIGVPFDCPPVME